LTIYKGATIIYSTKAKSFNAFKAIYYRDKLINYVIKAKSIAEAEFAI
jgi:hypothetical protein